MAEKKLCDYTIREIVEACTKNSDCSLCKFKKVHKFFCALCGIWENLSKEILDTEV